MTLTHALSPAMAAMTLAGGHPSLPTDGAADVPPLTHDLIESILVASARFIHNQSVAKTSNAPTAPPVQSTANHGQGQRRVFIRRRKPAAAATDLSANLAKQLASLAVVTPDIRPVHRCLLPRLPHAWPPTRAVTRGRADVLEYAHSLGLIDRWLASQPNNPRESLIALAIAGYHAQVLEWLQRRWPGDFELYCMHYGPKIRHAIVQATISQASLISFLEFWADTLGIDLADRGIFPPQYAQDALAHALKAQNVDWVRWWGLHTDLLDTWADGRKGHVWDFEWIHCAIEKGHFPVLDVCVELKEMGKVEFSQFRNAKPGRRLQFSQQQAKLVDQTLLSSQPPFPSDWVALLVDALSAGGYVSMLEQWIQRQARRGLPIEYSEMAVDLTSSTEALDWWLTKSGLPFKYSNRALHHATMRRNTRILDWWLDAFKKGSVPELKYNEWIMAFASLDWQFIERSGDVVSAQSSDCVDQKELVEVLEWWDRSGLDLKLPTAHDIADKGVPSPIDICIEVPVLHFWLRRAQRLAAAGATSPPPPELIQQHFPHYTHIAMHRAAHWNNTQTLDWWFKAATRAGLPLRYSPHRIVELAAMSPFLATVQCERGSLELLFTRLPEIQFRGSLLDWVKLGLHDAGTHDDEDQLMALAVVERLCASRGIDASTGGGMPAATDKKEIREEFVILPTAFFES